MPHSKIILSEIPLAVPSAVDVGFFPISGTLPEWVPISELPFAVVVFATKLLMPVPRAAHS